jgi:type I restriction enzyme S subunit
MKPEIKERIDKINRGQVPEGYKRTEVGIIPKDWEVQKLGAVVNFLDHMRKPIKEGDRKKGIYPYYGASGIIDYVDDYIFDGSYILLGEDGANILTRSSPLAFKVSGKIWVNNHAHIMEPKVPTDIDYITYYLESIRYEKYNTGTAQPKITQEVCQRIPIPFSKLIDERWKIGKILSTWDKAIELKEKLIEQKKEQKKGLMQRLLTGKVRLPGFKGEWEEVTLGEISEISTGNKDNKDKDDNGLYPFFVRSEKIERINSYSYDGEAILIPGDGRIGQIYHYINGKFDYHQRVYKISDFSNRCKGKFIYYYLQQFFLKEAMKYTAKATVDSLRLPMLTEMKIKLPSIDEQSEIVCLMDRVERNIELLEKELKALKQQKKGLMQLLLTGKVRVKC